MTYVKINDTSYEALVCGFMQDKEWNNRSSKVITLEMTYAEAITLFVDGLNWSIVHDDVAYDNSDYCIAGSITDNRNGTVTVKMGKPTELETLQAQLATAVTEEELNAAYVEGVNSL